MRREEQNQWEEFLAAVMGNKWDIGFIILHLPFFHRKDTMNLMLGIFQQMKHATAGLLLLLQELKAIPLAASLRNAVSATKTSLHLEETRAI